MSALQFTRPGAFSTNDSEVNYTPNPDLSNALNAARQVINASMFPSTYSIPLNGLTIGTFTIPPYNVILGTVTLA